MSNSHERLTLLLVIEELMAAEDWTSAEIMCTEALAEDAHNATLFVKRGIARSHLQSHSEALEDFKLAISLEPLTREPILGRARALLHIGKVDVAEDIVQVVLEEDIGDRRALDLLKQVALVKFRAIIGKVLASGQRTQLSFLQMYIRLRQRRVDIGGNAFCKTRINEVVVRSRGASRKRSVPHEHLSTHSHNCRIVR